MRKPRTSTYSGIPDPASAQQPRQFVAKVEPTAIAEIDQRQNDVLSALDDLNSQVEQLLADCTRRNAA